MSDNTDKDVAAASQVLQDMNAGRLTAWQAQQLCGWLGLPQLARSADRDLAKDAADARQCVEQVLLAIEPQAPIPLSCLPLWRALCLQLARCAGPWTTWPQS